jgi:hypothetical protein
VKNLADAEKFALVDRRNIELIKEAAGLSLDEIAKL